jgi:threonine aldolase
MELMKNSIDLRSDTVTLPTPAMRHAISNAPVGDDVYGEDPTTRALEIRASEQLNRESSLFVPSGSMGNQIAIHLHSLAGSEVIGEAGCHVFNFEMGAMAVLSGALPRPIRLVTHYHIDDSQIEETARGIRKLLT